MTQMITKKRALAPLNGIFEITSRETGMTLLKIVLSFLILTAGGLQAQDFLLKYSARINQFDMVNLRNSQESLVREFQSAGTSLQILADFPSRSGGLVEVSYAINDRSTLGLFFERASTGGRVHYQDRSGELTSDHIVNRNSFGTISYFSLYENIVSIHLYTSVAIIFTDLELSEELRVSEENDDALTNFSYKKAGFEPGFAIRFPYKYLLGELTIGYQLSDLIDFTDGQSQLSLFYGELPENEVEPQWSGLRVGFTFGVQF